MQRRVIHLKHEVHQQVVSLTRAKHRIERPPPLPQAENKACHQHLQLSMESLEQLESPRSLRIYRNHRLNLEVAITSRQAVATLPNLHENLWRPPHKNDESDAVELPGCKDQPS